MIECESDKGSFGHFSSIYAIKILKTSRISIFGMLMQASRVTQSRLKAQLFSDPPEWKIDYHGSSCAYGLHRQLHFICLCKHESARWYPMFIRMHRLS